MSREMNDRKFTVIAATADFDKGKGLVLNIGENVLLIGEINPGLNPKAVLSQFNMEPKKVLKNPGEVVQEIMDFFMDSHSLGEKLSQKDIENGNQITEKIGETLSS